MTNAKVRTNIKLDNNPDSKDGIPTQKIYWDHNILQSNQLSKQGEIHQEDMEEG